MSERTEMLIRAKELRSQVEGAFEHSTNIQDGELVDWLIKQAVRSEELDKLGELKASYIKTINQQKYENGVLKEENTRLRETLKFYADFFNYNYGGDSEAMKKINISKITQDSGEIARQALKGEPK